MPKCECPHESVVPPENLFLYRTEEIPGANHAPGECQGTYDMQRVVRDGSTRACAVARRTSATRRSRQKAAREAAGADPDSVGNTPFGAHARVV